MTEGSPLLRTLLLTDLCDSTGIVEKLGDAAAAQLFRQHDRLVLELQQRWRGRLIDRSDGLLLLFERPIDGLGFALDYLKALKPLGEANQADLHARVGLHVGEVLTWRNSVEAVQQGAKSLEVEGLAKPVAARLMTLARPDQILLSPVAEALIHRASRELGERGDHLLWKSYGRWQFKGIPGAQEIHEVGEAGIAPLRAPRSGAKAWRDVPFWRRPLSLTAEIAVLAAIAFAAWLFLKPEPAIAFAERDWVVMGDLRNLTGDPRLEQSLAQAFRISLEQSRYVNVLSDLKAQETLQRMQKPDGSVIDRAIASEIAMRDGVRAVILPTVSEVGGRLRVSAEVVDPQTQATVYAFSADGKGIDSALASIDRVTAELREKLGEALQSVRKTSVPLPNAATPSLEALKIFAAARAVVDTTRHRESALALYARALKLDPSFALAHADMARLHDSLGDPAAAESERKLALAIPERLSTQEKLYLELMQHQLDPPQTYFRKVNEYLAIYPDDDLVIARLATNAWRQLSDFRLAERCIRLAMKPSFPRQGSRQYGLGIYLLGQGRLQEALQAFQKSRQLGFTGYGEYYARAYDVQGKFDAAERIYPQDASNKRSRQGDTEVVTGILRGNWQQADEVARRWQRQARADDDPLEAMRAGAAIASVVVLSGRADGRRELRDFMNEVQANAARIDALYPPASAELFLLGGLLAAEAGDAPGVADALRQVAGSRIPRDYPPVGQLQQVVMAEQERMQGRPGAASERLRALARNENALVAVHWALARAQGESGVVQELRRLPWVESHRGRVITEGVTMDILRFFNAALLEGVLADSDKAQQTSTSH